MQDLTKGSLARNLLQTASFMLVGTILQTLSRARKCKLPAHLGIAAFDAVFCFIALRSNVLGASIPSHYSGLLRMSDALS